MYSIKVLKLVDGSELIGDVFWDLSNQVVIVKKPLTITLVKGQNGLPAKAFMDWLILVPDVAELIIPEDKLMCYPVNASKELEDEYRHQTTGLILSTQLNG